MQLHGNIENNVSDQEHERFIKSISFLQKIAKSITEMDKSTLTISERIELNNIGGKIVSLTCKSLTRRINELDRKRPNPFEVK